MESLFIETKKNPLGDLEPMLHLDLDLDPVLQILDLAPLVQHTMMMFLRIR